MKKLLLILLLYSISASAQENIPIESWRTHVSYRSVHQLTLAEEKVYCAAENGLFYFDKEEYSLEEITRINGMAEVEVSAIGWHPEKKMLIIGYKSGNIDLLNENGKIINIPTIKNSQLRGSKAFSDISFFGNNAFLCSPQGITVVNIDRASVTENYFQLGAEGTPLGVVEASVFHDSLFLATTEGVLAAPISGNTNLMDFNNWKRFKNTGGPTLQIVSITTHKNDIYAVDNQNGIFQYDGTIWTSVPFADGELIKRITSSNDRLFFILESRILEMAEDFTFTEINSNLITAPTIAVADKNNILWIGDEQSGLITNIEGEMKSYFPDGPFTDKITKLYADDGKVYGLANSNETDPETLQRSGFSVFEKGVWTNYNPTGLGNSILIPDVKNIVDVVHDPIEDKVWLASMSNGLLIWTNNNSFEVIDETSPATTLKSPFPGQSAAVSALDTKGDGYLWLINYATEKPLQTIKTNGEWESWELPANSAAYTTDLLISDLNDKWLVIDPQFGGEILVFNEEQNEFKYLSTSADEGSLPSNHVTSLAFDRDGMVWIGTDKGIIVLPTYNILGSTTIDSYTPLYNFRDLFKGEMIRCITVDGGNRKWIGTDNGAWLFGPGGDTLIYHFTLANSAMPSDVVLDIAIEDASGEVFIATDKGMVSFRSTATKATSYHQTVKIFPNPVKDNFSGKVGISGLAEGVIVKITDISGKLVRQMRSEGGTATWDVNDYKGKRAASGIYMIFSSTDGGEDSYVGKIAVIK